jgi:hypothetical protein
MVDVLISYCIHNLVILPKIYGGGDGSRTFHPHDTIYASPGKRQRPHCNSLVGVRHVDNNSKGK